MVIEVYGPSCAGKTTLLDGIERALRSRDTPVARHEGHVGGTRRTRRIDTLRALASPRVAIWCALNPRRARSGKGRELVRSIGLARRLRHAQGLQLLDEGPLKHVAMLARGSTAPGILVHAVPRPTLAILVTCDIAVRLARLRATARNHAQGMSDDELASRQRSKSVWNLWIADVLGLTLLELDTTDGQDWSGYAAGAIGESFLL